MSRPDESAFAVESLIDDATTFRSRVRRIQVRAHSRLRTLPKGPVIAMVLYAAFALVVSWPSWPGDPSRLRTDNFGILGAGDFDQEVWFLGWTAHALVHVLNPFYTTTLNYPFGIDIAQNTSTPLLGLLTAPLTWLFGPVASMNLLVWLAFPLSAASMFFVVRRFVAWDVAAFVGGAFYGFSPWILTQGLYHLNLCFVPLPPVILLSVYELFRREQRHPVRWGVALGLLTVAQFFITPEICAITLLVALVGVVACGASSASSVWPTIRRSCRGLGVAAGIVIACVAYPTYVTFYGQGHYAGLRPPGPGGEGADLLGPLLPTSREVFTLGHLGAIGSGLTFGNSSENGSYLGVPLLVLIILIVVRYWRRPWIRFCASMMLVTFVLSLGDHVDINNSRTAIALPDQLVQNLVIFRNVIQVRFGLLVTFFAGALVALGLDEMHRRAIPVAEASTVKSPFALNSLWANTRSILLYTLWILCVLTLLPKVPLPSVSAAVPPYFSSSAVDRIPANSVVLTYPYPSIYDLEPQVWQAVAQVRYKILGGYGAFSTGPSAGNYSYATPAALTPADVEAYLLGEAYSPTGSGGSVPVLSQHLECDARTFLRHYNVGTVLVGLMASPIGPDPAAVSTLFRRALGPPSVTDGQVRAWYHVKRDILENRSGLACSTG